MTSFLHQKMSRNQSKHTIVYNGKDTVIPEFSSLPASTLTIIATTNLIIDLVKFYNYMPITDFSILQKKRGRKRKNIIQSVKQIPSGSIISLGKTNQFRGIVMKTSRNSPEKSKKMIAGKNNVNFFTHSVSVVMLLDDLKKINIKVTENGKLPITGCKTSNIFIKL